MSQLYVLSVYDDTPYRQGMEYWIEHDLNELVEYMISQWGWAESSELEISIATVGIKGFVTIWSDEEIKEMVDPVDNVFEMSVEEITQKYPIFPEVNGKIYICRDCEVIYLDEQTCNYCGEKCCSSDEKCYDDKREQRNETLI